MTDTPFGGVSVNDERDALHGISRMLVGSKMLQNEPGVVYSLAAQQASPQDAGAIDQFMQALDAEKQVNLARATGERIKLTGDQQVMLHQNGVDFQDVQWTRQTAAQDAVKYIQDASDGSSTAKLNPNGTLALDAAGNIQVVPTHEAEDDGGSGGGGWFSSVGSFFGHVGGAIKSGAGDVVHGLTKAYNFTATALEKGGRSFLYTVAHPIEAFNESGQEFRQHVDPTNEQDMIEQGYDPNSAWSRLAFAASGKAHTDLSGLNQSYGAEKVNEALRFLDDPEKYKEAILQNADNWTETADGQPALLPGPEAKIKYLHSHEFETLARQVNAHAATVGNDLANGLGIDPVSHPTWYAVTSTTANIAASFALDPTLMVLKVAKVAKLSNVGIDTLADSDTAASILTRNSRLPWVRNVQRGWQRAIDLGGEIRTATAEGDTVKAAAAAAQFRAELPGLEPLMENFTGGERVFLGFAPESYSVGENGRKVAEPVFGASGGLRSLDDAAEFVRSNYGLTRLMNGRAATQASLMPGALSAFGYRKLKGLGAYGLAYRSASVATRNYAKVLSRAEADPLLAKKLIDKGVLTRMMPEADDAVLADGTVLAGDGTLALTPAGKGDALRNVRLTGDPLGRASIGFFSGKAIRARASLAATRLSTLLPRNTLIDLNDAQAGDRIYKIALTYLNRGDANTLRALWNVGDGGQRKAIISGLIDQIGHAAGLGKSKAGQQILDDAKTADEAYFSSGNEIELQGTRLAGFEGQTRETWLLPTFQAMQQAAAKIGLWESVFTRPLTRAQLDTVMYQWKIGALFKPSTTTRNLLEGGLRAALDGRAGDAIRARAMLTARNKDLFAAGHGVGNLEQYRAARGEVESLQKALKAGGMNAVQRTATYAKLAEAKRLIRVLEPEPIVQHLLASEAGDADLVRQIEMGSMLSGEVLGRSTPLQRLSDLAPLVLAGRAYRYLVGKTMDDETVAAFLTMHPQDLAEGMEGYRRQILAGDLGMKHAANEAAETAKAGWGPAKLRYAVSRATSRRGGIQEGGPTRWTHQALDGTKGVDRYADALRQRVNRMPETARAALNYIEDPSVGIDSVVKALEKEKRLTAFGTVYFPDYARLPNAARPAVSEAERVDGKQWWAQKVVDEYTHLLTGQNDKFQTEIADFIRENGHAPDGAWIADHITADNRPGAVLAPEVMAMPSGGVKSVPQALQDLEGGGYEWLVERPLQRLMSSPVFMANYAIARKGLNKQVERMVASGIDREAAENLARELSIRQSWVKTESIIDDPGQKTQFDVIARNMFPFSRATQAMIRRWGTGLWQNPAAARKLMLSYEGAVHSGFIYNNAYGEPTFTYPGSGAMAEVAGEIGRLPIFGSGGPLFPTAGSMTGQVLMSVPGADNPLRMGMGPMLAIPLRWAYKNLLPTSYRGDAEELDRLINGPIGTGETWSTLVPTAVRKFYQALSTDDRNSALASSMNGAIANLAAAGLIPSPDSSPAEFQQFRARLQGQVRSQLFARAVFGLFAPAAPTTPTEAVPGEGADFAWNLDGVLQLSDQYRQILNEVGGDVGRANAVFTALHPDQVNYKTGETKLPASAYETARSAANVSHAYLPATQKALDWLTAHGQFVGKYKTVAAYFLPAETTGEPFNDAAYQAEIELGLRLRKTPDQFLNDVYVKHAETQFYPAVDEFDRKINDAKAAGDDATAAQYQQAKVEWEREYKALNPLFGAKQDDYGAARSTALGQLSDLRLMLTDGEVPDGLAGKLHLMVQAYDNYEAFIRANPGGTDVASASRAAALDATNKWAEQELAGTTLTAVWNGVFRVLNSNFVSIGG